MKEGQYLERLCDCVDPLLPYYLSLTTLQRKLLLLFCYFLSIVCMWFFLIHLPGGSVKQIKQEIDTLNAKACQLSSLKKNIQAKVQELESINRSLDQYSLPANASFQLFYRDLVSLAKKHNMNIIKYSTQLRNINKPGFSRSVTLTVFAVAKPSHFMYFLEALIKSPWLVSIQKWSISPYSPKGEDEAKGRLSSGSAFTFDLTVYFR